VNSERGGVLNLNRYRAASDGEARLTRDFAVDGETDLEITFGFSDDLVLSLDGEMLFSGVHTFSGFENKATRGWVLPESNRLVRHTGPGDHRLEAVLRATEPFGWGLIVTLAGKGVRLLPMEPD